MRLGTRLTILFIFVAVNFAAMTSHGQGVPLSFSQLTSKEKLEVLRFRQQYLDERLRQLPAYKEINLLCTQNRSFKTYVARTEEYLKLGGHSFLDVFSALYPPNTLNFVGHNFLNEDIYDLLHSEAFYLAIEDCGGKESTRDAVLVSLIATDKVGKGAGLYAFYRLGTVFASKGVLKIAGKFFRAIPILRPLIKIATAGAVAAWGYMVYDIFSPKHQEERETDARDQERVMSQANVTVLDLQIAHAEDVTSRAEEKLKTIPMSSPDHQRWEEFIAQEKISILNLKLAENAKKF